MGGPGAHSVQVCSVTGTDTKGCMCVSLFLGAGQNCSTTGTESRRGFWGRWLTAVDFVLGYELF